MNGVLMSVMKRPRLVEDGVFAGEHFDLVCRHRRLPVDSETAISRLSGRDTKRKERSFDQASLTDLPVLMNDQ